MSADCITFDKGRNFFAFDGQYGYDGVVEVSDRIDPRVAGGSIRAALVTEPETGRYKKLTPNVLGKIIAKALLQGATVVQFETCRVSVNYLVEMLRFAGKHGWFHDVLSTTQDHAFDPNTPTPGFYVGEASELRKEARVLRNYARLARMAYQDSEAVRAEGEATEKSRLARQLLTRS